MNKLLFFVIFVSFVLILHSKETVLIKSKYSKSVELDSIYKFYNIPKLISINEIEINDNFIFNDTILLNFGTNDNFKVIYSDTLVNIFDFVIARYKNIGNNLPVNISFSKSEKLIRLNFHNGDTVYNVEKISEHYYLLKSLIDSTVFNCNYKTRNKYKTKKPKKIANNSFQSNEYEECVLRIYIGYLPSAITTSKLALRDRIIQEIYNTNQSYLNSNVNLKVEIARTSEIGNYNQGGGGVEQILDDFTSNQTHDVHTQKVNYYSDVLKILCTHGDNDATYGIANEGGGRPDFDYDSVIAVTRLNVTYIDYTFTHELGHLQGCEHQSNSWNDDPPAFSYNTYFAYGNGFKVIDGKTKLHSIMYTSHAPRILYWSNPNIYILGQPFGTSGSHHNARVLGETIEEADIADISAFETIDLDEDFETEIHSIVTIKAGEEVRIGPGFHAQAGSNVHAYIKDQNCYSSSKKVFADGESVIGNESKFSLSPNPTSGNAIATVEVGEKSICSLNLLDNLGNEVVTIFKDKELAPGKYQYDLEANNLSNGIYLCVLRIGNSMHSEKLVYLK